MSAPYKMGSRFLWAATWLTLTACGPSIQGVFDDDGGGGDGQGGDARGGAAGTGLSGSGASTGTGAVGSGAAGTGATGTGGAGTGASGGSPGTGAAGSGGTGAYGGSPGTGAFGGSPGTGAAGGGPGFCHDVCEPGPPMDPWCEPCAEVVCDMDPFCCQSSWDEACVDQAVDHCGANCFGNACASCGEILEGSPEPPCPGSEALLQEYGVCVCQTSCAAVCMQACQGNGVDEACQDCIFMDCDAELSACFQDGG